MFGKECSNSSGLPSPGCIFEGGLGGIGGIEPNEWLEETVWHGMRMWHVIFLSIGTALSFVILLCCCFKFRIPRTKQEIEGDYIRRKIMRKFRKRLKAIQNQELDEMDLKKALDKIRTELKSDTESLQQSDVLSGTTLSSAAIGNQAGSTYRRASQIQIDISLEDLRIQSMGLGARIALAFTRFFRGGGPKKPSSQEENGTGSGGPEIGGDTPTAALLPKQSDKHDHTASSSDKKTKESNIKKGEPSTSTSPEDPKNKKNTPKSKEKTKEKSNTKEDKGSAETTTRVTMEKETKSKEKTIKGKKEKSATETSKDSSSKPSAKETTSKSSTEKTKGESQKPPASSSSTTNTKK